MKAKLSPVEQELEAGFEAFRVRHQLSFRQFATALGGAATRISKSSVERICKCTSNCRFLDRYRAEMGDFISAFLTQRKFSQPEIKAELSALFEQEEIEMLTTRTDLDRSAQKFFGLKHDPFGLFPRGTEEVFTNKELDKSLEKIEDAVRYQGFVACVGEIGTGKTVLKTRLSDLADDPDNNMKLIWPSFFDMSEVNSGSIVIEVLRAFDQRIPNNKMDRKRAMINTLKKANDDGLGIAIVIDEAHRLNDRVLTALKNFYEMLGVKWRKFIGIVMFGQPALQGRLREVQFQEIAERLTILKMPALGKQAEEYLAFRLGLAGGNLRSLFDDSTIQAFNEKAKAKRNPATPLQLGNLCNQALITAFDRNEKRVTQDLLLATMPGLFISEEPKVRNQSGRAL